VRCALVAVTALVCGALLAAAIGSPIPTTTTNGTTAACELPRAVARLRRGAPGEGPLDPSAVKRLRRQLDALPETHHPLGL